MNEQLEKQLAILIEKSIAMAEKTGEFVIDQGSELIQQFFLWHTVRHSLFMTLGVAIVITGTQIVKLWGRKKPKYESDEKIFSRYYDNDGASVAAMIVIIVSSFGGVSMFVKSTYYLIYLLVAPKLYLIDYFL